ncbi:N-formylglutamate deformylase [Parasphingopyxis sp.]|uniref:N-formylglutamate deformylase n=1 Tax=Parasphingopyxis sp. TaxID=1920299 RepID=UPI00260F3CB5|nr:N-formylglutamate deformylase [Parasphingopyxis sp.]
MSDWVEIHRGEEPLIVSFPHTGSDIPAEIEARMASPWLARKDADWHVEKLYDFAAARGATTVRTPFSRSVIDVNRDPSGASLYPDQATTGLCPVETFDGEQLYRDGEEPNEAEIAVRRAQWFDPYHTAISAEIERLRTAHSQVVLYDAHSIRSRIGRLFDGELPHLNIGSFDGTSCAPELTATVEEPCAASAFSHVLNGRFRGGWTTRHYGAPDSGIHAIQMELACRGYLDEPLEAKPENWPADYDPGRAAPMCALLAKILDACLTYARSTP